MEYLTDEDYRIAEKNGISNRTAYQRFYKYGWTKKKTISKLTSGHLKRNYKNKCDEIGLSYSTLESRLAKGMKPDDALYLPKKKKLAAEQLAIAEQNGIRASTAKIRVYQYKWDTERAITEPVHEKHRRKQ